jgi:hypothetical protein
MADVQDLKLYIRRLQLVLGVTVRHWISTITLAASSLQTIQVILHTATANGEYSQD